MAFRETAQPLHDLKKYLKGSEVPQMTEVYIAAFISLIEAVIDTVFL